MRRVKKGGQAYKLCQNEKKVGMRWVENCKGRQGKKENVKY